MAKSTCLLALFVAVVVCTEAIRIDIARHSTRTGKHFPSVKKDDPRCKDRSNGLYPIPNDCTQYLKCVNGNSQVRKCPEGFKFDSFRHCTLPSDNPDCGRSTLGGPLDETCKDRSDGFYPVPDDCEQYLRCVNGKDQVKKCPAGLKFDSRKKVCVFPRDRPVCGSTTLGGPLNADEKCPETYGIFPVVSDCHKYMICRDGKPIVKDCPPHQVYRDINGACVDGDECPPLSSEESVCKRANQLLADEKNCRRYVKCVNFQPLKKECPPQTAFDPKKHKCSKEMLEKCKNNDILNVAQDE